jgi:hypothetical protein
MNVGGRVKEVNSKSASGAEGPRIFSQKELLAWTAELLLVSLEERIIKSTMGRQGVNTYCVNKSFSSVGRGEREIFEESLGRFFCWAVGSQ